jgi:RNA polymerase sigma-70 factor (ECF subfamily)
MARNPESETSPSLLERLRTQPGDQAAWGAFVARYCPRIYAWCRQWGVQEADAQDITQEVLLKLAQKMGAFQYDPSRSFRAWLKTLTQHAWSDFVADRKRGRPLGAMAEPSWETLPARDDLVERLDAVFEQELLDEAMARVRLRVKPHTWDAFRLQALEGLSGADTAARLNITVTSAFVNRCRVQKMIEEELEKLAK